MTKNIKINPRDNVFVLLGPARKGDVFNVDGARFALGEDIVMGHKVAVRDIEAGEDIVKYGYPIGHATAPIKKGCHVHSHNIRTNLEGTLEYEYEPLNLADAPVCSDETFRGYRRKDGSAGVRNELWVGVFKHNNGCSQMGDDLENTRVILKDMVRHPNAGGVLILGLGCEYIQMEDFLDFCGDFDKERVRYLVTHEVGDEIEESADLLVDLYRAMKNDVRVDLPLGELKIGLKCGGSDGMSGLTANPLLGELSDYLAARGGGRRF